MPYPASVVAYAFVKKGVDENKYITQMKAQKLVYFAHGIHLAMFSKPLVNEKFEAWKFGPVVPSIYQNFKVFGSSPITESDLQIFLPEWDKLKIFDKDALKAIDLTWNLTKDIPAYKLSNWTHQQGAPWSEVYDPAEWSTIIDNERIAEYFKRFLKTPVNA